jgi:hypothetical protein
MKKGQVNGNVSTREHHDIRKIYSVIKMSLGT